MMQITRKTSLLILSLALIAAFMLFPNRLIAEDFGHIEQLFDLRTSITDQGKTLPDSIRKASGVNVRTLEQIFELNTSALTTVEAYFRIVKISVTSGSETNAESVKILNEWLLFIKNQCGYDVEFLDESLKTAKDEDVVRQLNTSRRNIQRLAEIVAEGVSENSKMIKSAK